MSINLFDAVGIIIYLLLTILIYKKSWFYSLYSFVKFIFLFLLTLLAGLAAATYNPYTIPVTKLEQALIIQLVLFLALWRFISFKKGFFMVSRKVFNIDRFIFTHHINKFINIFPSLIASFFVTFFLFNIAVSAATTNPYLQNEIDNSKIIKTVAYKIYFTPIAFNNLKLFEGSLFKITPPTDSSSDVDLKKIADSTLKDLKDKINLERVGVGLAPIFTIPTIPPSQAPIPLPGGQEPIVITNPGGIPRTPPPSNSNPTNPTNPSQPGGGLQPIGTNPNPTAPPSNSNPVNPVNPVQPNPTTAPVAPTSAPAPVNPAPPSSNISQVEQDIFRLTNEQRAKNGLSPYVWDDAIAAVARAHSKDMSARNFFSHVNPDGVDPFQRMRVGGISFSYAGENIAGGPSADIMMNNWMNSPGHRANILNSGFRRIGVGVAQSSTYGLVATQDFTN